jgi:hypothetical protein
MPRRSTIHHPEPREWFSCPVHGCSRKFRSPTGRTKHIRAKHNENDERSSLSVSKIPRPSQAPVSFDTTTPIDSDHQDADMPDVPHTPDVASDFGFLDGTNMAQSPIPNNNDRTPPSPQFQPEIENHHDQVLTLSTNYHSFINGMT